MAPTRSRICLACRTLLGPLETCSGGRQHVAVALDDPGGRKRLWDEVWGPDSRARQLRRAVKAGAGGGIGSSVLDCAGAGCNPLDACTVASSGAEVVAVLAVILLALVAALAIGLLVWLSARLVEEIRERMDKPKPHGALLAPPKPRGDVQGRGIVKTGPGVPLPWKPGRAVAYAFELHEKRAFGGGAMLRDAATAGFEIELADGRVVRVPAGRLRILGKRGKEEAVERERLDAFLREAAPGDTGEDRRLFPYEHVRALVLSPGDRVELLGDLEPSADPAAAHAYRASAGVLIPIGVPVVRVREAGVRVEPPPPPGGDTPEEEEEGEGTSSASWATMPRRPSP